MPDDRRDDRRDEDDDRERERCRPPYGNLHERVETIKRAPPDDSREYLRTIIRGAFDAGRVCGMEEECECIARLLRAEHCCRRREDDEDDEWGDRDRGDGDRRRRRD